MKDSVGKNQQNLSLYEYQAISEGFAGQTNRLLM